MGCCQDCLLHLMFSFQRDQNGKLMTTQKRFPDLTDGANEVEQGLIDTCIHPCKIHYAFWYTFNL